MMENKMLAHIKDMEKFIALVKLGDVGAELEEPLIEIIEACIENAEAYL